MNIRKIYYMLNSGKNFKLKYYAQNYIRLATPKVFFRKRLKSVLENAAKRDDYDYIKQRVDYCNRLTIGGFDREQWEAKAVELANQPMTRQKVYFFDSFEYSRWFPQDLRWVLLPGDVNYIADVPSIVKSRPIAGDNANSVLLNMDKVRHFLFVDDKKPWREKRDVAIFRGDLGSRKANRDLFMERWFGDPMIDAGMTNNEGRPEWKREKLTIAEHLDYKFIMSLEGHDVASNLKWVMSSNCIAVSPRLTCETWFMEGQLKPNYHYIEVKDDFSDLTERLHYYMEHPEEAEAIIEHAHEWVAQFQDARRERIISLLVLQKYFQTTNP